MGRIETPVHVPRFLVCIKNLAQIEAEEDLTRVRIDNPNSLSDLVSAGA